MNEEISGMPLGLSRDYDLLPKVGPLRMRYCTVCDKVHEDAERLTADGCRVLAIMCSDCRTKGRDRWIVDHVTDLPRAVAHYRTKRA